MTISDGRRRLDVAYLGLWPITHKSEGLNVLLCDMIRPLIDDGISVVIHTTDRHVLSVTSALEGNSINITRITINTYSVGSFALRILHSLNRRREIKDRRRNSHQLFLLAFLNYLFKASESVLVWALDLTRLNWTIKLPVSLIFLAGLIVLGLLLSGLTILSGIIFGIPLFLIYKLATLVRKILRTSRFNLIAKIRSELRRAYVRLRANLIPHLLEKEQIRFANALNKQKLISRVFFFTAFDGYAVRALQKKAVVVFPDAVTYLFPLRFAGMLVSAQMIAMRLAVTYASGIICYSKFVRDAQLRMLFPDVIGEKQVEVIPQGYFVSNGVDNTDRRLSQRSLITYTHFIKNIFPNLLTSPPRVVFGEFDYLLYPTIDRPHKNITTLIKAFSLILRTRHLNLKLILTSPHATSDVRDIVISERLQYDVIFMPSVPIDVLDLLFKGAALMVHPSLAEGGDIFNFSRAVSVRCPALLANIPVVTEMFERENIAQSVFTKWLFDPADPHTLAELILDALSKRDELASEQNAYLEQLSKYDFREMAYRYLDFIEKV
jgi:Glycosyl transferases group 1